MSAYRRGRPSPPVTATPEVVKPWRALAELAAAAAAAQPSAPLPALKKLADRAKSLVVPGVLGDGNPCVRLSRLTRRYVGETTAGRRALQAQLAETVEAAREYLDAEEAGGRADRKDLDQ